MKKTASGTLLPADPNMDALLAMMAGDEQPKQDEKPPKLLARSGSDPQFDNIAYLSKIELQTIQALKA